MDDTTTTPPTGAGSGTRYLQSYHISAVISGCLQSYRAICSHIGLSAVISGAGGGSRYRQSSKILTGPILDSFALVAYLQSCDMRACPILDSLRPHTRVAFKASYTSSSLRPPALVAYLQSWDMRACPILDTRTLLFCEMLSEIVVMLLVWCSTASIREHT